MFRTSNNSRIFFTFLLLRPGHASMLRITTARKLPLYGRTCSSAKHLTYDHGAISDGQKPAKEHRRRPSRGGQNLSERYIRLENSLRGKAALSNDLNTNSSATVHTDSSTVHRIRPVQIFRGFEVPKEPKPPADDECCMSGCAVCVYDLFEESLEAYQETVSKLRTSLSALGIPEYEWPSTIQTQPSTSPSSSSNSGGGQEAKRKESILSAFEEMERALAIKKQTATQASEGVITSNSS